MSDVKQTIQVTNAGLSPILSIAQGTGMVEFEFTVSDFQIPTGSTAVAHNIQPTGNIVSQVCALVGNVITVTPPAYYFLRGKNYMQIQVTGADGVNLFTFLIEVWCSPNISAPVASQNPDLITQLIAMIGNMQDLDTIAKNNLVAAINEIYARGDVDIDILDTMEEIEANTDAGKAAGALAVKELSSELRGHIVWTNPNPASNFTAQSVTLSESINNYSYAEIVYKGANNAGFTKTTGKLPIVEGLVPYLEFVSDYAYRRQVTEFSGTTITFADAMYFSNPSTSHVTNNLCIPYQIILYAL